MKLEDQVVSLELAKKLKELGVKQESAFYWRHITEVMGQKVDEWGLSSHCVAYRDGYISAFTVAELLELIPYRLQIDRYEDGRFAVSCFWTATLGQSHREVSGKFSESLAKMLIYLIEKGIVKP